MADLTNILIAASQADPRAAEQHLEEYLKSNYGELAKALATELATEGKPLAARQVASIYLKNMLMAQSASVQKEKHDRWKQLDAATRTPVKEALLQAMRSGEPQVPHFTAVAAAEIAVVELPFQEWPQFVPALMENVTSAQAAEPVKIASLQCLGYTCERIADIEDMLGDIPKLAEETVDSMLTTIVDAVQPNKTDAMRFAALQALKNSLTFVRKNMQLKSERDFILKAICEATGSGDPQVRGLAYNCMDLLAELHYDKLQDYMPSIFKLTTEAIKSDPDDLVKMAAIEFWSTLSYTEQVLIDDEREYGDTGDRVRCNRYVEAAKDQLVPLLLETLTKQDPDEIEDEWDLRASGATCLEVISQTIESLIVPVVIPFVQQHIQGQNWRFRDAAIVAFNCILDGPSTDEIGQYVQQSIPVLLGAFNDAESVIVRESALLCVDKIARLHLHAVPGEMIHTMIQSLMDKLREEPRVAKAACSAIFNIAHSLKTGNEEETNLLSTPMLPLMQAVLNASDRQDAGESNLRITAMAAAAELIAAAANDVHGIFVDLLPAIVGRFDSALRMQTISSEEKETKEQLLGLLSSLIQVLFQQMEKKDVIGQVDRVMELLLQGLQVRNATCHEEVFFAVGAIANVMEEDFVKYMPAFMPLLLTGLRSFQAQSLCTVSVGVVVDICTAVAGQIQPYCDDIMRTLMECLKDASVHRDVKPIVISCFGDIAMAIGAAYEPYLQHSVMLLMQAAGQQAPPDNEEMIIFINSLRLSILEAYSGIVMGLADGNALQLFLPTLPGILQFLQFLASSNSNKDEDVLQRAVALIGDIASNMGSEQQVRQQINQPFIAQLIQEAMSSNDESVRKIAEWSRGAVQNAIQAN